MDEHTFQRVVEAFANSLEVDIVHDNAAYNVLAKYIFKLDKDGYDVSVDEDSGFPFFYNRERGESEWKHPREDEMLLELSEKGVEAHRKDKKPRESVEELVTEDEDLRLLFDRCGPQPSEERAQAPFSTLVLIANALRLSSKDSICLESGDGREGGVGKGRESVGEGPELRRAIARKLTVFARKANLPLPVLFKKFSNKPHLRATQSSFLEGLSWLMGPEVADGLSPDEERRLFHSFCLNSEPSIQRGTTYPHTRPLSFSEGEFMASIMFTDKQKPFFEAISRAIASSFAKQLPRSRASSGALEASSFSLQALRSFLVGTDRIDQHLMSREDFRTLILRFSEEEEEEEEELAQCLTWQFSHNPLGRRDEASVQIHLPTFLRAITSSSAWREREAEESQLLDLENEVESIVLQAEASFQRYRERRKAEHKDIDQEGEREIPAICWPAFMRKDGAEGRFSFDLLDVVRHFRIFPLSEPYLVWIANEALYEPLPEGWRLVSSSSSSQVRYRHQESGKEQEEHPLDSIYQFLIESMRKKYGTAQENPSPSSSSSCCSSSSSTNSIASNGFQSPQLVEQALKIPSFVQRALVELETKAVSFLATTNLQQDRQEGEGEESEEKERRKRLKKKRIHEIESVYDTDKLPRLGNTLRRTQSAQGKRERSQERNPYHQSLGRPVDAQRPSTSKKSRKRLPLSHSMILL